jgi:transcriptional regulator with XRE-family HTH domain
MPKLVTIRVEQVDHLETGRRARKDREKAGISLRKVAELMGLSPPYLSRLERGRDNWNANLMAQFENALKGIKT